MAGTANPALLFRIEGDASDFNRAAMSVQGNVTKLGNVFNDVFASGIAQDALYAFTSSLKSGAAAVFDYTSKLEQTKVGFTTLMKNARLAAGHIAELEQLSRSTPLQFENIATLSQRLQGAGIEAAKIIPLIKDIGNTAAATGSLAADRMEGIGVAFAQIVSKGKVSAEELEQLAERGIPAWKILSESIGKTAAETRKMAEDGKISSQQMLDAFQKFSRANYGDAMQKQAKTFSGAMQQIQNIALQVASKAFKPFYDEISKFASKVAESLKKQETSLKKTGVSFGFAFGEAIGNAAYNGFLSTGFIAKIGRLLAEANQGFPEFRAGIAKGYNDAKNPVNTFPDYSRPDYDKIAADQKKAAATQAQQISEEERKKRQEARDREIRANQSHIDLLIKQRSEWFDQDHKGFEDAFDRREITEEQWREVSERNFEIYSATVKKLLLDAFKLDAIGKTPSEIANLRLAKDIANAAVDKAVVAERENREQKITGLVTKANKERKDAEDEALDAAAASLVEFDQLREQVNDREKDRQNDALDAAAAYLTGLDDLRDEVHRRELERQEIESARLRRLREEEFGRSFKGMFSSALSGIFGDAEDKLDDKGNVISKGLGIMGSAFQSLKAIGLDAFSSLAQGFGQLVSNWVLYGEAGAGGIRKLTATILSQVAATATTYAIMCLAAAALATTVFGGALMGGTPAQFLKAAALFGAVAVGAAITGRGVAGTAFQNSSGGGGGSGGSGEADNGNRPGLAFTTRFNGFLTAQQERADAVIAKVMDKSNAVIGELTRVVKNLDNKIEGVSPGDVLARGIGGNEARIAQSVERGITDDPSTATNLKAALSLG